MNKKNFVFSVSWQEVLMEYPAEVRLEVYDAVIRYAASGTLSELKPLSKMAFSFIKNEIDYNNRKYDEKVENLRANASKGGLKRAENAASKQLQANATNCKQMLPIASKFKQIKQTEPYNVYDNVNVNVSKENAYGVKETPESPAMPEGDSVDFEKNEIFQKECEAYALEAENFSKKENSGGAARKGAICGGFDVGTVKPPSEARKARSIEENVRICQESASWLEAVAMQNGMTVEEIKAELAKFPEHLTAYGSDEPKTLQDFKSHFNNYLKKKRNADDSTAAHGARKGAGAAAGGTLGGRAERPRPKSIF